MAFVALYDANVLYPGSLRDLMIRLGCSGLYQAKWTEHILDEAFAAIASEQPEIAQKLDKPRERMKQAMQAIPDVTVTGYEDLIPSLDLPDPDNRHVLAAAIACNAQVVVTSNVRHFPARRDIRGATGPVASGWAPAGYCGDPPAAWTRLVRTQDGHPAIRPASRRGLSP